MIERTFFSLVLVAMAAAAVLTFAEPARVASAQAPAATVIHLERVVITASREDSRRVAATSAAADPTVRRAVE